MKVLLSCKYGKSLPGAEIDVSEEAAKVLIVEGNASAVKAKAQDKKKS